MSTVTTRVPQRRRVAQAAGNPPAIPDVKQREELIRAQPWRAAAFLRERQIIAGDEKAKPPQLPIMKVSRSYFRKLITMGLFPKPVEIGGPNVVAWTGPEVAEAVDRLCARKAV